MPRLLRPGCLSQARMTPPAAAKCMIALLNTKNDLPRVGSLDIREGWPKTVRAFNGRDYTHSPAVYITLRWGLITSRTSPVKASTQKAAPHTKTRHNNNGWYVTCVRYAWLGASFAPHILCTPKYVCTPDVVFRFLPWHRSPTTSPTLPILLWCL